MVGVSGRRGELSAHAFVAFGRRAQNMFPSSQARQDPAAAAKHAINHTFSPCKGSAEQPLPVPHSLGGQAFTCHMAQYHALYGCIAAVALCPVARYIVLRITAQGLQTVLQHNSNARRATTYLLPKLSCIRGVRVFVFKAQVTVVCRSQCRLRLPAPCLGGHQGVCFRPG
eukprot:171261-Chlamydomonas_euryale.AAC.2